MPTYAAKYSAHFPAAHHPILVAVKPVRQKHTKGGGEAGTVAQYQHRHSDRGGGEVRQVQ